MMKTSARNQLAGTVKNIKNGAVNDEVIVTLKGGQEICATITCESREALDLKIGNRLNGTIRNISRGSVYSLVEIDLGEGVSVIAGITIESMDELQLRPGQNASALFKAGSVILGVPA